MPQESGVNVLLKVGNGASPEVFATLGGQQDTELTGDTTTADITDKSNNGWGSMLNVLRNLNVTASGKVVWPDTTGLAALRTAWQTGANINCELILNAAGDKYTASMTITAFNVSGSHTDATMYNITLANAGAPTYTAGT